MVGSAFAPDAEGEAVSVATAPALLALAVFAGGAIAAEPAPRTLEEQRVTATALPTTPAAASQHVTLLSRSDLDAYRGESVAAILSRQAGIVVDRGARSGGYGALYLRGADPSHVVVLIDHVRQNDPLSSRGSAVDLNTLSTDDIDRIEIVRGNASVANAEAIAGLIHIFTRRSASGGGVGASVGGEGLREGHATWAAGAMRAGGAYREDGDGMGGFGRTRAANVAWDGDFDDALSLHAAARIADSENSGFPDDSGGARHAVLRDLESRHGERRQVSLRSEYSAGAGTLDAQLASFSLDGEESTPGVAPGVRDPFGLPPIVARSDYRRDEAQMAWRMPIGDASLMLLGVQHQRERGRLDSTIDFGSFQLPAAFSLHRATSSLFAEARWQAGDWTMQGGLRGEWADGDAAARDDSSTHPMLSLQHAGDSGVQWGASVSRASKLPSFYALGQPLVGNPLLAPETATHREVYCANAPGSSWPTRLTLFSARYRDLIDFDAGPPPQLVNRARIETSGIEWRSSHRFANDWQLQLDGAWMRVRDPDGGTELRHRPRVQAGAQLGVPLGPRRELSLMLRHLGRRFDSSIPTGDRWLSSATTLDLTLRQQVGPLQLLLALENAGDTRSEETIGTPLPARRMRLSLHWPLP